MSAPISVSSDIQVDVGSTIVTPLSINEFNFLSFIIFVAVAKFERELIPYISSLFSKINALTLRLFFLPQAIMSVR